MFKLLIVDDEPFIRQGIRTTIPWEDHGIQIVGEASNGKSGLKLALQLQPDIIIADISMPGMNGLELAARINEFLPDTEVIILTAYGTQDNFIGAFEAKVSRFVLKSADASSILQNVLQVKEEIEKRQENAQSFEQLNYILNENQHLIKSTLFSRFLNRQMDLSSFCEKAQKLQIPLYGPQYVMLLAKCKSENEWLTIHAFQNAFSAYDPFSFFIEHDLLLILLNTFELTDQILREIYPELKPYILGNQFVCLNGIQHIQEFEISFQALKNRLHDCFWNSDWEYSIITPQYVFPARDSNDILSYEKAIVSDVLCHNLIHANQSLSAYYSYCRTNVLSQSDFLESIKRLLLLLSAAQPSDLDIHVLVSSVCHLEYPEEILEAVTSLLHPSSSPAGVQKPQITAALNYINENYDKEICLEDVSQHIYLSVGYLSRIFKAETGYSFKEWLHHVRIEKAKELIIHTNLKYYEIAEKVGYKDYKYFSAYFTKLCGCTAKEYKLRHQFSIPD